LGYRQSDQPEGWSLWRQKLGTFSREEATIYIQNEFLELLGMSLPASSIHSVCRVYCMVFHKTLQSQSSNINRLRQWLFISRCCKCHIYADDLKISHSIALYNALHDFTKPISPREIKANHGRLLCDTWEFLNQLRRRKILNIARL
jgi:hypothetical protein